MKITIDIGGTNTRIALFKNGDITEIKRFPTIQTFKLEMKEIISTIKSFDSEEKIEGIGISTPGPTDYENGVFGWVPNLQQWENCNIILPLKKEFEIDNVKMGKDANLMALAYHNHYGNSGGITLFFTVSTGLGGGLIIGDKIYKGHNGFAFEVDNAPVAFSKEKGKDLTEGSLEYFSSGSGIATRSGFTTKQTFEMYNTDETCKKIIDEGIDTLANMIATSIAILNPSLLVFDGPIARYENWYVEKAVEIAKTRTFDVQFKDLEIKIGDLNDDAGLRGAYHLI